MQHATIGISAVLVLAFLLSGTWWTPCRGAAAHPCAFWQRLYPASLAQ